MSLTSHLKDPGSPIGQFLRSRFAHTASITSEANAELRNAKSILPVSRQFYPYGTVGTAMDYRFRYYFAHSAVDEFVAYEGAARLIKMAPAYRGKLLQSFFTDLTEAVTKMKPVHQLLEDDAEVQLIRYCFVLALLEEVFRSGLVSDHLMLPAPRNTVAELLAIADDAWVDEMSRMSRLFYEQCRHLLTKPFVLNPVFAGSLDVGGADADLVVDGCLLEIKTSVKTSLEPQWLRQLAGYVLLDYEDALSIRSVGIYMARQGILLTWPLDEYLHLLTGDGEATVSVVRSQFRDEVATHQHELRAASTRSRSSGSLGFVAKMEHADEDSKNGNCTICGHPLTYTVQYAVEQAMPRGRTRIVDIITVRCETCNGSLGSAYDHSVGSDLDSGFKRRVQALIATYNKLAVTGTLLG